MTRLVFRLGVVFTGPQLMGMGAAVSGKEKKKRTEVVAPKI
jgi:hypothetical protein